jgi:hypothetical protein
LKDHDVGWSSGEKTREAGGSSATWLCKGARRQVPFLKFSIFKLSYPLRIIYSSYTPRYDQKSDPSTVGTKFSENKFFRILIITQLGIFMLPKEAVMEAVPAFLPIERPSTPANGQQTLPFLNEGKKTYDL